MKISILTFHWATNYGAVLQAYALQKYISNLGADCTMIDYYPSRYRKSFTRCFRTYHPTRFCTNLYDFIKDRKIELFRKKHLVLTPQYASLTELKAQPPESDVYVCGSDQIWNPSFTSRGEGDLTLTYFLDFGVTSTKRISYAASFGCTEYPDILKPHIIKALKHFSAISVREQSGQNILINIGFPNAVLMPDPTLLLYRQDYESLLVRDKNTSDSYVFVYALHRKQYFMDSVCTYLRDHKENLRVASQRNPLNILSIADWLYHISHSKAVVTNSFHGVVFSILFHKTFIAVPVEGINIGMNDRLTTLLGELGLNERVLYEANSAQAAELLKKPIDWNSVDMQIARLRKRARAFLSECFAAQRLPDTSHSTGHN